MDSRDKLQSQSRRTFLNLMGAATLATAAADLTPVYADSSSVTEEATLKGGKFDNLSAQQRVARAFQVRVKAGQMARDLPMPEFLGNGDEERYARRFASYSKALPHNSVGEVEPTAYDALLTALSSGRTEDFNAIPIAGALRLENPQGGKVFELQGPDPCQLVLPPAPVFESAQVAAEMVELYWMALTRDVPFARYDSDPLIAAAADDLSRLSDFRGPKEHGKITPATIFRGTSAGEQTGPYVSQFLLKGFQYGAFPFVQRFRVGMPGVDHLTGFDDWLAAQNGQVAGKDIFEPLPRYVFNGRALSEVCHNDPLYQLIYHAAIMLFGMRVPRDQGNPYTQLTTTQPFVTFGPPFVFGLLASVMPRALSAIWFNKWYVHRRLRPEEFGGRVHNHMSGAVRYPIHSDLLNSKVLDKVFAKYGTYLLPQAFPEGCPTHPAYGAGHAAFAAAGVTVLKAFFNESAVIPDPVMPSADGNLLAPYTGAALTVGGELNKLAANIAIGRNIAGVHWRTDASLELGESVAVSVLRELREVGVFLENFTGFSLTKFDGTKITV